MTTMLDDLCHETWDTTSRALKVSHHAFIPGKVLASMAGIENKAWVDFADYWNRLTLDRHMGDGGTYRLRRYGQFNTQPDGSLLQLPHGPYEQPRYINPLNGGILRTFEPLEEGFARHPVLHSILQVLRSMVDEAAGETKAWNIRLHPYRIVARDGTPGLPTPEGLHRDGVHYIVSLLVRRQNVSGGESLVTDMNGHVLASAVLQESMQTFIANDERTMHAVSEVKPMIPGQPAWRDVLVVAFTKQEAI